MNFADRLKQVTVSSGTASLALGAVPAGFRSLSSVFGASQRFVYVVQDDVAGQWELGWGFISGGSLVRETPLEGSSATPVAFGSGSKSVFVAHVATLSTAMHLALFGSGVGSDSTVTGTVTQGGDGQYQNLTVQGAGKVKAAGYRVKVRGILNLLTAAASAISNDGQAGNPAVVNVAGLGGLGGVAGTIGGGNVGTDGAPGAVGNGVQATASAAMPVSNGGRGAPGAAGGNGSGGATGAASLNAGAVSNNTTPGLIDQLTSSNLGTLSLIMGGTGGTGGSSGGGDTIGGASGGGGGGGGGGGVLEVSAGVLVVDPAGTATGAISARGGAGGAGGTPAAGNRGGGGAAGPGGGGYVRLIVGNVIGSKPQLCTAQGGDGGTGGAKTGSGVVGNGSDGANGGTVDIWNLSTGTLTRTTGLTGQPHSGQAPGAGGVCYGDV